MLHLMKCFAVLYVLVLSGIVFLADRGQNESLFAFVREMPYGDKFGHLFLMGAFSFVCNLALGCRKAKIGSFRILQGTGIVLLLVTLEEISQMFIPRRSFDVTDLFFDYAGIFIFGRFAHSLTRKFFAVYHNS